MGESDEADRGARAQPPHSSASITDPFYVTYVNESAEFAGTHP
jgi:hypothetical protein